MSKSTMNRLEKLRQNCRTLEDFINKIKIFPRWYLETEDQRRMTKKDLREFYLNKGGR